MPLRVLSSDFSPFFYSFFFFFGQRKQQWGFSLSLPLSIVSMSEILLRVTSPELNWTVLCGLSPKATFVRCTVFLHMDTLAVQLYR